MSRSNQSLDETVISMGARRKKRPSHVPMIHIENESMILRQRPRANTGDSQSSSSRQDGNNNGVNQLCDKMDDAFITPPNPRLNEAFITPPNPFNDSGFHGDSPAIIHSDPDWYLRPRKLSQDLVNNSKTKRKSKTRRGSEDCSWISRIKHELGFGHDRKSFTDHRPKSSPWFTMTMDTLLASLVFIIIIASLLFTVLISIRFFEPHQSGQPLNGKYQSMAFAREKAEKLPLEEVVLKRPDHDTEPADHIPRDLPDDEDEIMKDSNEEVLDYEDPSTFRGKDGAREGEVAPVDVAANIETVKKLKAKRSKNKNPLKPKKTMSKAKKKDGSTKDEDPKVVPDSIENDYDDPPSNFRGKQPEVVDLLNDNV